MVHHYIAATVTGALAVVASAGSHKALLVWHEDVKPAWLYVAIGLAVASFALACGTGALA